MIPGDLMIRRLTGKSGTTEDLARSLGVTEDRFHVLVRDMRHRGDPVTTHEDGIGNLVYDFSHGERVCAHEGCDMKLSRYNPTPYCTLHTEPEDLPDRWFKDEELPNELPGDGPDRYCPECGEVKPLDREHFVFSRRWSKICRDCVNARRRARAHA